MFSLALLLEMESYIISGIKFLCWSLYHERNPAHLETLRLMDSWLLDPETHMLEMKHAVYKAGQRRHIGDVS